LQLNCKAIGLKYYLTKTSPSCEWEDNRRPLGATISTCFLLTFLLQVLIKTKNGWHAAPSQWCDSIWPSNSPALRQHLFKEIYDLLCFFKQRFLFIILFGATPKTFVRHQFLFLLLLLLLLLLFAGEFSTPSLALKIAVYKDGETLNQLRFLFFIDRVCFLF